ncbi:MAG: hypothetical protein Q7T55_00230, partial [Solirubrobacteraceae bacterium]|nr:hypothetical protein [Solirubrobacteraceae bacterium]
LVLLGACGIPRMNFAIRVHAPEIAKDSCIWFDKQVEATIEDMACIKLSATSRALLSLPTALGGCGFTNMEEISPLAYQASLSQIGPKEERVTQDQLTLVLHLENAKRLRESSPQTALHMDDCKGPGNSNWMQSLEDVDPMSDEIVGAALRTRFNELHIGHGNPVSLACIGCGKSLHPAEGNQHLSGCARVKGRNCACRHAGFKNCVGRCCTSNGILHSHNEPQGYEMRVCTLCRAIFPLSQVQKHITECEGCEEKLIKEASSVRPDKWIELKDEKGKTIDVVVDVSVVAVTTATNINEGNSVADALKERERRKHALYGQAAEDRKERFLVVAITPNGTMSEGALKLCTLMAKTSDSQGAYTAKHAARDLKRGAVIANATSLINAEKASKAYFSPKSAKLAEEIATSRTANAHAHAEEFAEQEDEWYELPEEAHVPSEPQNRVFRVSVSGRTSLPPTPPSQFLSCRTTPDTELLPETASESCPPSPRDLQNTLSWPQAESCKVLLGAPTAQSSSG